MKAIGDSLTLTPRQEALFAWVKEQHGDQKRKYTFEPYWHHLQNVASLVQEHAPDVEYVVEIALCHDLIEDTEVDAEFFQAHLIMSGYNSLAASYIVQQVNMITDQYTHEAFPEMNRKRRKELEAEKLISASPAAQTVKYADIIDNLTTIADHDPDFARIYISEKEMYIGEMNKGSQALYELALEVIEIAKNKTHHEQS